MSAQRFDAPPGRFDRPGRDRWTPLRSDVPVQTLEPFPPEVLALHAKLTAPEKDELALIACRIVMMNVAGRFPTQVAIGPETLTRMRKIIGMDG
jgi:hypothetical protein